MKSRKNPQAASLLIARPDQVLGYLVLVRALELQRKKKALARDGIELSTPPFRPTSGSSLHKARLRRHAQQDWHEMRIDMQND